MLKMGSHVFLFLFSSVFLMGSSGAQQKPVQMKFMEKKMENYLEKSLEMANLIEDKRKKSGVLTNIAGQIAKCTQDFDKAVEVALSVPEKEELTYSLSRVVYSFLDKGDLKRALETVLMIPKLQDKYFGLVDISAALKDEDKKKKFNVLIVEYLLKDLEKVTDRSMADSCIDAVAKALIYQKDFEQGLKLAELYYDLSKRDHLYYDAVSTYSSQGDFDKAAEIAHKILDKSYREDSFDVISQDMIFQMKSEEGASDSKEDEAGFLEFSEVALREKILQP